MQNDCPVMWTKDHHKSKRKFIVVIVMINLLWIGAFASNHYLRYKPLMDELTQVFNLQNGEDVPFDKLKVAIHEYRIKYDIMRFLRTKGLSLGQGMDIAEAAVTESKANDIPIDLAMSLILTESEFSPGARSPKGAIGILQLMPDTWREYTQKMNLQVGLQAMYDPNMNIKVGMRYFGDVYKASRKKYKTEMEARRVALSEYNSGPNGGIQPEYVSKVEKDTKKFSGMVTTPVTKEPTKTEVSKTTTTKVDPKIKK
jgi:soluble lytic murein transglycosylase-like protein